MTIAVALSASSTVRVLRRPPRAGRRSRGRRRAGPRRTIVTICASRRPPPAVDRHGRPHARVELLAERLRPAAPRPRARSTSPSASRTSPCPASCAGTSSRAIMTKQRAGTLAGGEPLDGHRRARPGRAEDVDRPGARAELAQAVADGVRGRGAARAPPRAGGRPSASWAASVDGVRAARAVRGAVGVALARELDEPLAVEEQVGRLVAVPAGDDDDPRAERVDRARELPRPSRPRPRRRRATRASGTFGVTTVARGRSSVDAAPSARPRSSSRAPDSATITGSSTTGVPGGQPSSARATASIVARVAEHADLHGVDAEVARRRRGPARRSSRAGRLDRRDRDGVLRGDRGDRRRRRARPQRANALRSAWMPAPPPESEPAIDSTTGIGAAAGTRGESRRVRHARRLRAAA